MPFTRQRGFTLLELVVVVAILVVLASLVVMQVHGIRENAQGTVAQATMNSVREALMGSSAGPGYLADMKRVPGFRSVNIRMQDLFLPPSNPEEMFNLVTNRGWRGPYVVNAAGAANINARNGTFPRSDDQRFKGDATYLVRGFFPASNLVAYGDVGAPVVADPWGNPIVVQIPSASAFKNPPDDATRFRYARIVSAGPDGVLSTPLEDPVAGMHADGVTTDRVDDIVIFLNRADTYEEP